MTASTDLTHKLTAIVEQLAQETDAARLSAAFSQFVETAARFHNYSAGNIWLIMSAMPTATRVAGYNAWRSFNRFVRKGEHGIPILAPCTYKKGDDETAETRIFFKIAYVFDVSQTEGEPLPEPPNWKSPAHLAELDARLTAYAESMGIQVTIEPLRHAQGTSCGGAITLDPTAGTKTLIHEIAHELLHHCPDRRQIDRETREIEAESIAYAVAVHFELPDLASPNYIALSGGDSKAINACLTRIVKTADQIITALELPPHPSTDGEGWGRVPAQDR